MKINNLKEYFGILGWQDDDVLFLSHNMGGKFDNLFLPVSDAATVFDDGVSAGFCLYYSCGVFRKGAHRRLKSNVAFMRELVIDIDFKAIDSDRAVAIDKADTMLAAMLPIPTVQVHSGNGYHLHYRLSDTPQPADYEAVYQRLIGWINSQYPDYLDSVWSCEHVFRLPFSFNCKDKDNVKPVQILAVNDVSYNLDDFKSLVPGSFKSEIFSTREGQRNCIQNTVKRELKKTSGLDRSQAVFSIVNRVSEAIPRVSDIAVVSVLKQFPELTERYADDKALRKDVRRIMVKHAQAQQGIVPVLPVETTNLDSGYDLHLLDSVRQDFDGKVFSSRGDNEQKFDAMLQVYDRLWDDRKSGIVSVPCSSSKTYSALIYAAYLSQSLRPWSQKIWFVSEKIEDCKRNADVLDKLGARAVAYHGRPADCPHSRKDFFTKNKPCKTCTKSCGAKNKYLHSFEAVIGKHDIICTTHAFLRAVLSQGEGIPAALTIIDESPELLETYELDENTIALIQEHLSGNEGLADMLHCEISDKIRKTLSDKGTHRIEPIDCIEYEDAVKVAYINLARGAVDAVDKLEAVLGFFNFFSTGSNIYGMKTGTGSYRFMAGEVDIDAGDSVVWILDGSAKNQLTRWENFSIFEVPELAIEFPHTRIKLLAGNPTKTNLAKNATKDKLVAVAQALTGDTILFANKTVEGDAKHTVDAVADTLKAQGCTVIDMARGEHIGSNRGRTATNNMICMSLFSDVSDYALKASLFHGREIGESEIFGVQKNKNGSEFSFVKLNNGGFENPELRDIMTRSTQRDLYQAVMRGVIRDKHDADYNVTAITSDTSVIVALQNDLPKAKITIGDSGIITMWIEGDAVADIVKKTGENTSTVKNAIDAFKAKIGIK